MNRIVLPAWAQALFWPVRVLALLALLVSALSTHAHLPVLAKPLAEVGLASPQPLAVLGDRQMLRADPEGDRKTSSAGDTASLPRPALAPTANAGRGASAVSTRQPLPVALHPVRPFSQAPPRSI